MHLLLDGLEARGVSCSVTIWTDDLRYVGNLIWARLRFTRYPPPIPLSLFLMHIHSTSLYTPPPSPSGVARQVAASPRLSINNWVGYWLLPPRCRNILFPLCVPGQGVGGGGGGPERRGCSDY